MLADEQEEDWIEFFEEANGCWRIITSLLGFIGIVLFILLIIWLTSGSWSVKVVGV